MADDSKVLFHALFRPRSLFIGLLGGGSSLVLALLFKWWFIVVGMLLTSSAYGWSVAESMSDRDFIAHVERPALPPGVSDEVKLTVAAKRGSRLLEGPRREEHQQLAALSAKVAELVSACSDDTSVLVEDLPHRLSELISGYETLALEAQDLEQKGENTERQNQLNGELNNIRQVVKSLEGRMVTLTGDPLDNVQIQVEEMWDEVKALETTVEDLKLLE